MTLNSRTILTIKCLLIAITTGIFSGFARAGDAAENAERLRQTFSDRTLSKAPTIQDLRLENLWICAVRETESDNDKTLYVGFKQFNGNVYEYRDGEIASNQPMVIGADNNPLMPAAVIYGTQHQGFNYQEVWRTVPLIGKFTGRKGLIFEQIFEGKSTGRYPLSVYAQEQGVLLAPLTMGRGISTYVSPYIGTCVPPDVANF